ncbi:unnamed protein product [Ranitomeya imitator]|uniref:FIIND domain-containing protein n=1 Tax=Ranitomeya imitator TaxID=111125 RepID=A0ABN9MIH0_9NEOB|nr:unnamed protein product [Ranitomeya imitator]
MTYKAIHNLSPPYICDLVSRYLPTRNLRSSQDLLLYSPLTSSSHNRIQDFSRVSPLLWNPLPQHIRLQPTIETFKKNLKTHLFRQAYNLHLSIRSSGLFCCSESGIQFRVTQPVTLEYEVDSWSNYTEILQNLPGRYEIIGPLFNIKSNVEPNVVSAVYLPHCLCLGGFKGEKSLIKCFHYRDDNMAFETPSRIEAMYAVMENPTFSCIGIILYPLRLFKEGIIKRIPCHGMVLLFYSTIIKDDLNHMYRLHLYLLPRIRTVEKVSHNYFFLFIILSI